MTVSTIKGHRFIISLIFKNTPKLWLSLSPPRPKIHRIRVCNGLVESLALSGVGESQTFREGHGQLETALPQADGHLLSVRGMDIFQTFTEDGATGNTPTPSWWSLSISQGEGYPRHSQRESNNWKHPYPKLMVTSVRGRDIPDIHRGTGATGNIPTPSLWSHSISQGWRYSIHSQRTGTTGNTSTPSWWSLSISQG